MLFLLEKLKDRYNILFIAVIFVFLILSFKLATLTVVEGDNYRKISDTKRVKEVPITAPRGDIRDRYGRLLAGTKPSFTVQVMRDEIDKENLNTTSINLLKLLEENGENYIDEFPIELNVFDFKDDSLFIQSNETAEEQIIDILIQHNLISELLDTYYVDSNRNYKFFTVKKALLVLEKEGVSVPINIDINQKGRVELSFKNTEDIGKWKISNNIPNYLGPKDTLIKLINNDKNIIRKILNNPIVRELTYDLLTKKGLSQNFKLNRYSFTFDEEYKSLKKELIKLQIQNISMDSKAQDDFINIVKDNDAIISELFGKVYKRTIGEKEETIIPGKILLDMLKEKGISIPIIAEIDEELNTVNYSFKDSKSKMEFYNKENIASEISAKQALINISKKTNFIDKIIIDDRIKFTVQELVLNHGINPRISISSWEYVPLTNKKSWLGKFGIKDAKTAEEAFKRLREKYEIDDNIPDYEARYVFVVREQLSKQGYMRYQPINFAYGIKDKTVATILENNIDMAGVNVSIEPVRYYPMGSTAAHILGYLGKISQSEEIRKYVQEMGYSPNDIIGKTGVESKFEEYLRGKNGSKFVEVDVFGNTIKTLEEKEAIPGNDLFLTIDAKLQQVAEESLKHALKEIQRGGEFKSKWGNYKYRESFKNATTASVVAIDVKTGEVLALANYPAYDPNLFATGISTEDWESLKPEHEEDPLAPRPLYNVALRTAIQPGSTFKMITALAALEKGISPTKEINDLGYVEIGNQRFGCWIWNTNRGVHGWENLYEAIRDSCNYYFYTVTLGKNLRTGEDLGIIVKEEDILRIAKEFGLNSKTGIEVPGEESGRVPDPEVKMNSVKNSLERFLKGNIKNYIKDDVNLSDKEISKAIEEITSWVSLENTLSRGEVIKRLSELGIDPMKKMENGINITDIITYSYLKQAEWKQADTLNISIGQGQNSYTPIQMANYIATLSNGGNRHRVSVVQKVTSFDGREAKYLPERETEKVKLRDYSFLDEVKKGMAMVTSDPRGTAYSVFKNFPVKVGAKTGTAEKDGLNPVTKEGYDNYAWFVAFAPYDDPQIAVSVVIFQGGHGGYAAPIAREIIAEYLGLNNNEFQNINFTNKMVR